MRILIFFLALLIACSPVDNVPSSPQDLSLADLTGSPPPDLTITVTGPTRIVQRTWTGSDGVVVKLPFELYDTVEKIQCAPKLASDSVARCMPINATSYFQDAACSVRVAIVPQGCVPEKYYLGYTANTCGALGTYTSFRTGAKTSLTKLYSGGTPCSDISTLIPVYDFYSLVAVPASTFAAGTFNY